MSKESFKWQKLLWAIVIIACIYLYFSLSIQKSNGKLGAYPYIVLGWWIATLTVVPILILRFTIVKKVNSSFFYILVGSFNLFIGLVNTYYVINGTTVELKWIFILLLPLLLSIIILIDFIRQ